MNGYRVALGGWCLRCPTGSTVELRDLDDSIFETVSIEPWFRELEQLEAKYGRDDLHLLGQERLRELIERGRGWLDRLRKDDQ